MNHAERKGLATAIVRAEDDPTFTLAELATTLTMLEEQIALHCDDSVGCVLQEHYKRIWPVYAELADFARETGRKFDLVTGADRVTSAQDD